MRTFCPHLGRFLCSFFFYNVSAQFHLWPSSGDLPRPRIGMLSFVTVSPVITAFHSFCLLHHVFNQVNFWPAWVGIETAIFWQCSPGTIETQRLYPLRQNSQIKKPRLKMIPIKNNYFKLYDYQYFIKWYVIPYNSTKFIFARNTWYNIIECKQMAFVL